MTRSVTNSPGIALECDVNITFTHTLTPFSFTNVGMLQSFGEENASSDVSSSLDHGSKGQDKGFQKPSDAKVIGEGLNQSQVKGTTSLPNFRKDFQFPRIHPSARRRWPSNVSELVADICRIVSSNSGVARHPPSRAGVVKLSGFCVTI
ncbi:hypothetical protein TNCV_4153451 [Trichonephila clavipes]|nr:hypothetical protein TNCV_4153451 [Trichonephila clavipes]